MYSTLGEMEIAPRKMRARSGQTFEIRQRVQGDVHFARRATKLIAPHIFKKRSGSWFSSMNLMNVSRGSTLDVASAEHKKLLGFLGQLDTIGAAPFHPNTGNIAYWGGLERDIPTSDAGFHVSRAAFDALMRQSARAAGVSVVDAVVRDVQLGERPCVRYLTTNGETCDAGVRMVLDCSGRAGIVARRGFRKSDVSYRTLAIAAEWESARWPARESTRTLVESYDSGWAWSVPLSASRRQCTVMIDPGERPARPGAARRATAPCNRFT